MASNLQENTYVQNETYKSKTTMQYQLETSRNDEKYHSVTLRNQA